jgi:hypothetical protein
MDETSKLIDGRQRAFQGWVLSVLSVSCQKVNNACESREYLPLRWRQLTDFRAQSMVALLEESL